VGLKDSQWFKRGWTLQELLVPQAVEVYDHKFSYLGTRSSLASDILKAACIAPQYLQDGKLFMSAGIATKMSWMSDRVTTVPDDVAYCMLGIFGISMDVRYGEREKAFLRLQ
jgi:hypothetical protein